MRHVLLRILSIIVLGVALSATAFAQENGDYRSKQNGNWGQASTWEMFNGSAWIAAPAPPTGSETITISDDTVTVDVPRTVSGLVQVTGSGLLTVGDGSLTFADGGTYEHARDEGEVPTATWQVGSTFLLTGSVSDAPDDTNQDFHNITINTPELGGNEDLGLDGVTIGGDIRLIDSGDARWRLTSASATEASSFTIMGDVIVEGGSLETQGTGNALTTFEVHHWGDIIVTGGNFSVARGSQGSGSGTTTWFLYGGDFLMSDAETKNSNPTPGNAKLVFAGNGTQALTFDNVDYAGGDIHFEVSDSTTLQITNPTEFNGLLVNRGEIEALGELTFLDGAVYEHAVNGGEIPSASWEEGSTALITGVTTDAPGNRGQDYYNLTLDTPGLLSNKDLSLDGNTIGGDLTVLSSGSARWRLVGGGDAEVTIMGDVIVRDASLETQGTGSPTTVVVHHYGNVDVDGGNFSVSRGSQGSGTGTSTWFLYEGDFSMSNAKTQNSNPTPGNARFVFADGGVQALNLGEGNDISNLSIEVSDSTTLDLGASEIGGNGIFWVQDGASLATSHTGGLAGNLQTEGDVSLGVLKSLTFYGSEAQTAGAELPDTLGTLRVSNSQNLAISDTTSIANLVVDENATLAIDSTGSITTAGGSVDGTVVNSGELIADDAIAFGGSAVYEHARNEGSIPEGTWAEGSTVVITGVTDDAPDNSNQNYHHLVFNTPNLSSNEHMDLDEATIGGDVTVVNTGSARWYLTSASAQDTSTVTIMGDVNVQDGAFSVQGTGNALTTFVVDHFGDINVTGGNFSVSRGSQGNGSGTTTWYIHEGDFNFSDAKTQNSNPTPGNAKFVFDADGVQNLVLSGETDISNLSIEVSSGTTLDVGSSEIDGSGVFNLNAGATLATSHVEGVAGNVQTSGLVTLSPEGNFTFNGTEAQVTSELMPIVVNDVVIDNEAGVTLSQATTINGVLRLVSGQFDNTIPFTLGPNAEISREGGSLAVTTSSEPEAEVPTEFALYQNYPNPFNPSTVIRYDIREVSDVTVKIYDVTGREVMDLVHRSHTPGSYEVEWDARGLSSGVYYYQIRAGEWSATKSLMLVK